MERTFVAVFRAHAAIRIPEDEHIALVARDAGGTCQVLIRTRWQALPGDNGAVPRTLWIEVVGPADSMDDARERFQSIGGAAACILALATNASVEQLAAEVVFDATPSLNEHEFFQEFQVDDEGVPRTNRRPDITAFLSLFGSLMRSPERDRLVRAAAQYQIGIQHLQPGREVLALAHLWMAVEALTKVVLRRQVAEVGSQEDLVDRWGITLRELDGAVRKRLIFQGDAEAYDEAAVASNGFEHGFLDFLTLREYSTKHARVVARYVRDAILDYADLEPITIAALRDLRFSVPIPSTRHAYYLRATLVGSVDRLAHPDSHYPIYELRTTVTSVVKNSDGGLDITRDESFTPRLGPGVEARDVRFEMWGPDSEAKSGAKSAGGVAE